MNAPCELPLDGELKCGHKNMRWINPIRSSQEQFRVGGGLNAFEETLQISRRRPGGGSECEGVVQPHTFLPPAFKGSLSNDLVLQNLASGSSKVSMSWEISSSQRFMRLRRPSYQCDAGSVERSNFITVRRHNIAHARMTISMSALRP